MEWARSGVADETGRLVTSIGEPLPLEPVYDAKIWGGRRLERLGKRLPDGAIGESLESGGGARIRAGRFAGQTVDTLVRAAPKALLGSLGLAASGTFDDLPLLVKLIDANDDLSIQVHPTDALAPPGKRGKTEAWLVLDAEPGASLITGLRGSVDMARIEAQLVRHEVRAGDVWFVPAGTVHAIGRGVLLYEIQEASDVTWRLYDWGRPREVHVAESLRVARQDGEALAVTPLALAAGREMLVACRYFALERWTLAGSGELARNPRSFRVATLLAGGLRIAGVRVLAGDSLLLPADLPDVTIEGDGTLLIGYVPDLDVDVIGPLRAAGHPDGAIRALGIDATP